MGTETHREGAALLLVLLAVSAFVWAITTDTTNNSKCEDVWRILSTSKQFEAWTTITDVGVCRAK